MTTTPCYDVMTDTNGETVEIVVECAPSPRPMAPTETTTEAEMSTTGPGPTPVQADAAGDGGSLAFPFLLAICLVGAACFHPRTRTHARRVLGWPTRAKSGAGLLLRSALLLGALVAATSLLWDVRLLGAAGIVALGVVLWQRTRRGPEVDEHADAWWRAQRLGDALVEAGVTKPPPAGEGHRVRYLGQPRHDDAGTTVVVDLPGAGLASQALSRREALARALRVPLDRFDVATVDGAHPGVVRLWVGSAGAAPSVVPATVPERSSWAEPVRIGTDKRGATVTLPTHEANTLVAGVMGYGKTSTARVLVGHALLDPTSRLWVVDGKGSTKDWGDARAVAERFVLGSAEDAVEQTQTVLDEVLAEVRRRNAESATTPSTGALLLLLDEWQDVRASAGKVEREALDATLGRIIRTGRAVGSHVVIVTQRPTVEDVPSGARNLLSNRLALVTRNAADAALTLGEAPTLALPRRKGEALLATPTGMAAVRLDYLSDEQWRALCKRAAGLRGATGTGEPGQARGGAPAPVLDVVDPDAAAVVEVLRDGAPEGMTAGEILAARGLPAMPQDTAALGRWLRRHPDLFVVPVGNKGKVGGRRLVRLTDKARSLCVSIDRPGAVRIPS